VGVVGCNNPKIRQDYGHVTLTQRLIENDILVVVTGCAAVANGKAGHMMPAAAKYSEREEIKKVREEVGSRGANIRVNVMTLRGDYTKQ
jgi:carbon-monoxide dehydrogenase catalytic subunit